MPLQKPSNGMAKQKAPKAIAATQQLASFCDAIFFVFACLQTWHRSFGTLRIDLK
jgi:hypothetical protein